jgi:hypothetical protein
MNSRTYQCLVRCPSIAAVFRRLRCLSLPTLAFVALSLVAAPFAAQASTIAPPVIAIEVQDALLAQLSASPVFSWPATVGRPLQVVATISRTDISAVDVYLAVFVPGGRVFSWVPSSNAPALVAGLAPAGRALTASSISFAALLGSPPQYLFSASDPVGMYSLAVIIVAAGSDPSDPRRWFGAVMSPLLLTN